MKVLMLFIATLGIALVGYLPMASSAEPVATASARNCGSFHVVGLLTPVRVQVIKGPVGCERAHRVMKKLFNRGPGATPENWSCIGPQTGYARCWKADPKRVIVAHF